MNDIKIKRTSYYKIYLQFSWLFSLPVLVFVPFIFIDLYSLPIFTFVFFNFISLINLLINGVTLFIEFKSDEIIVKKNEYTIKIFKNQDVTVYRVKVKSWWTGICIENENDITVIWKHEFNKEDWKEIENKLSSITKFLKTKNDYTGFKYIRK